MKEHPQEEEKEYLKLAEHYLSSNPKSSALEIMNEIEQYHPKLDSKLKELYEKEEMTDSDITGALMGIVYEAKSNIKRDALKWCLDDACSIHLDRKASNKKKLNYA